MRRLAIAASLVALGLTALAAPAARAEFGSPQLVSKIVTEQAPEALAPVLSGDGRYIAFQGILEGRKGVFRASLQSGAIARVATGDAYEAGAPAADATAPSISADGRYVSFTTRTPLDPVDDTQPNSEDVYVADMAGTPPTYELASAADGSPQALPGNSAAAPRVALSGDGRKLAFFNSADGGQIYLRDLDTDQTTLVSVARDSLTGAMEPGVPVPGGGVTQGYGSGAALSADGTTVAWLGAHLPAQVPLLSDEEQAISAADAGAEPYDEPLWRRVADGALAPTRRIIGGGDPLAPGCPGTGGTLAIPVCRGPFPVLTAKNDLNQNQGWLGRATTVNGIPQLSADGRAVALIGNPTEAGNVFLVDMAAGLSRVQAVRQLTAHVPVETTPSLEASKINAKGFVPLNGWIYDLAISADGRRIAFTTARQRFPLAPPSLVTPPPTQLGLVEVYLVDLETQSLQRLTHGFGGSSEASLPGPTSNDTGEGGRGAASPSLDGAGRRIAFATTASNMVRGDGNENADVFVSEDVLSPKDGAGGISPPPANRKRKGGKRLVLSGFSMPDGRVRVVAVAPAKGTLRTSAAALLGADTRSRRLDVGWARARPNRPVATILVLPRRLRRLARSEEGLYATARVEFRGRGGKQMHGKLAIRFRVHSKVKGKAK